MKNLEREEIRDIKPYVPGKPVNDVKREYNLDKVIKLASNENPIGASPKVIEVISKNLNSFNIYPDGYCYDLRKKLSEIHNFNMNNFCFGDGSNEILGMLTQSFVNHGDEVIYCSPSFVEYNRLSKIMGATPIQINMAKDMKFDLNKILDKINDKTKMIFICNPNNPTGTIVTKKEVGEFIEKVPKNIIVVFDEAYFEFAIINKKYPDSLEYQRKGYNNIVTLRTFSKAYGLAALRVGYAIADKEIIDALEKVRYPFNVSTLAQLAALTALDDYEHVKKSVEIVIEGKNYIYSEFDKMNIEYIKTDSNFLLFKTEKLAKEVFDNLLKRGIIIRPMGEKLLRVSFGTMEENICFVENLKRVLK